MGLVERIKFLCDEKKVTFAEVERKTGISNGQIRRWDNSSPKIDNVRKVAEYFDVSTDYLLGRTDIKRLPDEDKIHTIAAHHDGEEWTEEELEEIERFKEFVKLKRKQQ
ncbi:helix-turn-helix domain-containing protein [Lederbergia sp. NSJ-179]|uniref:helix-turn-helix domain-containing protein n=1 Tax=Lederbergia sp. NSJ-179 TaxID=2931402 RepID=UPI001FD01366|nr:helix-turn-helix transcriptional regulator [Lederbergia sp. NSJ-179]MCJ7839950.1 helix-turn-helix domain-containing protein [Lederbergia sp. NSJ-179]